MFQAALNNLDRNGDGDVSADEIPARSRRLVLRLDTNRDGAVDAAEILAFEDRVRGRESGDGGRRR